MKRFYLPPLVMLLGLAVSGNAAAWSWSGTLASWAASGGSTGVIVDGDGDMAFQLFNTTDIPDGQNDYITLSELEIGGVDYYDVGVNWDAETGFANGYAGGGQLVYSMSVLGNNEAITSAALDSIITGTGTTALKILRDLPANTLIANLSSFDGSRDPATGYTSFAGRSVIGVQDIFQPSTSGVFQDAHNSFTVVDVPEPMSLALLAIGLAALGVSRQRTV